MIQEPPVQGATLTTLGRFVQTWILWFQSLKNIINEILDDISSIFTRVEELEQVQGWAYYDDSLYTSGSPLNVNNTTANININGLGSSTETSFLPTGVSFYDTSTYKITPQEVGDSFILRFDFKAICASNNVLFDVEIDIGSGSPTLIYDQTLSIVKGSNTEQRYALSIPTFCLATFVANGGQIKIATTNNINFYDFGLFIARTSNPL